MSFEAERLILAELREFRSEATGWQLKNAERISALETEVAHGVTGNGQPSRLQLVEKRLEETNKFRFMILGGAAVIAAIFKFLIPGGAH